MIPNGLAAFRLKASSNWLLYRHFGGSWPFRSGTSAMCQPHGHHGLFDQSIRDAPIWRFELVREIHRREIAILWTRLGRRKCRKGTGAA